MDVNTQSTIIMEIVKAHPNTKHLPGVHDQQSHAGGDATSLGGANFGKLAKTLLGSGAGVKISGSEAVWSQRGGYAKAKLSALENKLEQLGFVFGEHGSSTGQADEGTISSGLMWNHPSGYSVKIHTRYGAVKDGNYFEVKLLKTPKLKHLPGQHDQQSHAGIAYTNFNDMRRAGRNGGVVAPRVVVQQFKQASELDLEDTTREAIKAATNAMRSWWSRSPTDIKTRDEFGNLLELVGTAITKLEVDSAIKKHLPGRHNQQDHAGQSGAAGKVSHTESQLLDAAARQHAKDTGVSIAEAKRFLSENDLLNFYEPTAGKASMSPEAFRRRKGLDRFVDIEALEAELLRDPFDFGESDEDRIDREGLFKHLPGRHDQRTHASQTRNLAVMPVRNRTQLATTKIQMTTQLRQLMQTDLSSSTKKKIAQALTDLKALNATGDTPMSGKEKQAVGHVMNQIAELAGAAEGKMRNYKPTKKPSPVKPTKPTVTTTPAAADKPVVAKPTAQPTAPKITAPAVVTPAVTTTTTQGGSWTDKAKNWLGSVGKRVEGALGNLHQAAAQHIASMQGTLASRRQSASAYKKWSSSLMKANRLNNQMKLEYNQSVSKKGMPSLRFYQLAKAYVQWQKQSNKFETEFKTIAGVTLKSWVIIPTIQELESPYGQDGGRAE